MSRNIVCVILAAGHSELLYKDIKGDQSGEYKKLRGKPKALLPAPGGKCILDFWWDAIKMRQLFADVYLVSNADKYKHFERWATASDFPLENLINDGSTLPTNSLGSLADFELVLRVKNLWEHDVVVIAGDMLFQDCKFEMSQVLEFFRHKSDGDVAIYYEMHESECTLSRGIVEVCSETKRINKFLEKPMATQTTSRYASVVFYCFRPLTLQKVLSYLKSSEIQRPNFGCFMQWLINDEKVYEGLIYMDFTRELMEKLGHGHYEYININSTELPRFFLTYLSNPSDSGKIHSDVSTRFHTGDKVVEQGMSDLASLTDETLVAINERRWNDLAKFMQKNFSLRRQMYGDAVLGEGNLKMIEIGQKHGVAVKFPGSGGAVLGLLNNDSIIDDLREEYQSHGCVFVEVIPHIPQRIMKSCKSN